MPIQSLYAGLRPLTPYEPVRPRLPGSGNASPPRADGQLVLELPTSGAESAAPKGQSGQAHRSADPLSRRQLRAMLTAILELHEGRRSPNQVRPLLTSTAYQRLLLHRPSGGMPSALHQVHACQPASGVVEACATVHARGRACALAARVEFVVDPVSGRRGRWLCTRFDLLLPRAHRR